MKCIYCNYESELTVSDIITYAITGTKLRKKFVCTKHNAFTNDNYEKKFVDRLDFFRNCLGLTTRDGEVIKYTADIIGDNFEINDVKLSDRKSFYNPKGVVKGKNKNGEKQLIAPTEKMKKISDVDLKIINMNNISVRIKIYFNDFFDFYVIHSMAKMAYEWYCYINNIEEYKLEYQEIVNYILGISSEELVDIIIDKNYYTYIIDEMTEIGDNTFFQYDDVDGYRYVVIDFWKTISYRIKICKSPIEKTSNKVYLLSLYIYHIDGSGIQEKYCISCCTNRKIKFITSNIKDINDEIWKYFIYRIEKIVSTTTLSIYTLKKEVDKLFKNLEKYDLNKIDFAELLDFEDDKIVTTINVISQLYLKREKYDKQKTFNQNLKIILNVNHDGIYMTPEEKRIFVENLKTMDKEGTLSEYIKNGINIFNEIYLNEIKEI